MIKFFVLLFKALFKVIFLLFRITFAIGIIIIAVFLALILIDKYGNDIDIDVNGLFQSLAHLLSSPAFNTIVVIVIGLLTIYYNKKQTIKIDLEADNPSKPIATKIADKKNKKIK